VNDSERRWRKVRAVGEKREEKGTAGTDREKENGARELGAGRGDVKRSFSFNLCPSFWKRDNLGPDG
jgi:hypothetical protein